MRIRSAVISLVVCLLAIFSLQAQTRNSLPEQMTCLEQNQYCYRVVDFCSNSAVLVLEFSHMLPLNVKEWAQMTNYSKPIEHPHDPPIFFLHLDRVSPYISAHIRYDKLFIVKTESWDQNDSVIARIAALVRDDMAANETLLRKPTQYAVDCSRPTKVPLADRQAIQ
jgi:hypothetical protein